MNDDKSIGSQQPNNPMHGVKLIDILEGLVAYYGWDELGEITNIRSFTNKPTIKSSLKLLRKTPWARAKVEELYMEILNK